MIINVFIQNNRGSNLRNKYDEGSLKFIKTEKLLIPAVYQYGFIPGTRGDDGDCIDAWLISDRNYNAGTIVKCRILGMLEMFESFENEKQNDFKIFSCPENEELQHLEAVIDEIKIFTIGIFKKFPDVTVTFGEFHGAKKAEAFVMESF